MVRIWLQPSMKSLIVDKVENEVDGLYVTLKN
jgi:hypothetical protein